ncbi:MAG: hypothetical protein R2695_11880 [Acidimicrobiales bacterium]
MARTDRGPHGVVVLDKPAGWTSHDVVAKARGVLGTRKIGHSGTLDPDATGVLVLGVGRATRLLRFLTDLPKSYEGEIVLGVETSTLDASGEVTATHEMDGIDLEQVEAAAAALTGEIEQVPPMVSAVKVGRSAAPRVRPGGQGDRTDAAAGHGASLRRHPGPGRAADLGAARSTARPAPTSVRWPPISGPRSAVVPICGAAARPSADSRLPDAGTVEGPRATTRGRCGAAPRPGRPGRRRCSRRWRTGKVLDRMSWGSTTAPGRGRSTTAPASCALYQAHRGATKPDGRPTPAERVHR